MSLNRERAEVIVWALLALLGATAMHIWRPLPLFHDSYQYLSCAQQIRQEHRVYTSLIHNDSERAHGYIPAPATSFAPGYPALLAVAGYAGDPVSVARVISGFCYAGTVALVVWGLILIGVPILLRIPAALLLAANVMALQYSTVVLTEPLFMLMTTAAVILFIWAERRAGSSRARLMAAVVAYALLGLACWVRYAGYFVVAALVIWASIQIASSRSRERTLVMAASLAAVAPAGALMLRNLLLTGNWRGGSGGEMAVSRSFANVCEAWLAAHRELIFGWRVSPVGRSAELLLAAALAVVLVCLLPALRQLPSALRRMEPATQVPVLGVAVYSAAMFYTAMHTVISFDGRMFLPILPLYALGLGAGVKWLASRASASLAREAWLSAALALIVAACAIANWPIVRHPFPMTELDRLAELFAQPTANGRPLMEWVNRNISATEPIVAANGLATGYLLQRPTLSMIGPEYSAIRWEGPEVRRQMQRYRARFLILYRPGFGTQAAGSHFAADAVAGRLSRGFSVAAENQGVRILQFHGAEK